MVKRWQCENLSVYFVFFDVLVECKMHAHLLYRIEVRVKLVFYFVAHPESASPEEADLLERILVASIFQVNLAFLLLLMLLLFLKFQIVSQNVLFYECRVNIDSA
jgi:hypothetical protein